MDTQTYSQPTPSIPSGEPSVVDALLESWVRSLDIRDEENEGHTRRVIGMTLNLAKASGVDSGEWTNIRRGALLHDIGKIGVPESILNKPGPLTEHEWEIMRRHPALAFDLLSPIEVLHSALDIPWCHHEFWDGSGYPRGLKRDQIPLAARIFSVVDVWDSLTSSRPFRLPWQPERVKGYLLERAGTQFDPQIVDLFIHNTSLLTQS
jgi:HD-GYP domain-containing protein (c-di-GMP phosphodiesterase class II)